MQRRLVGWELTAGQGEQALSLLVVPDLDLVVVTSGDEDRLSRVERDTTNGSYSTGRRGGVSHLGES